MALTFNDESPIKKYGSRWAKEGEIDAYSGLGGVRDSDRVEEPGRTKQNQGLRISATMVTFTTPCHRYASDYLAERLKMRSD